MKIFVTIASITIFLAVSVQASVRDGPHNLSASGPGQVRAAASDRICEFCHISHSSSTQGALWSRAQSAVSYIPYSSSTAVAQPGQPTGDSLLCLSCHDGTVALGQILGRGAPVSMAGGSNRMPQGPGLTGTDLRDDHPISFEYSTSLAALNGELAYPGSISAHLPLDGTGQLQCTTCHDAHDSPYEDLLRVSKLASQICVECHQKTGWAQTSHSQSVATWSGIGRDPWPSSPFANVRDNGCQNCHAPHNVAGGPRLLIYAAEEKICSDCHSGEVAEADVMSSFEQISSHRLEDTTLVHDPEEPAVVDTRHVECVDCHDPHASRIGRSTGDTPANVRGVNLAGAEVDRATEVYEICLRCHGDSPNQPPGRTPRQHDQTNIRLQIQLGSPSFHPIAGPGRSLDVPSLISPLTEQSTIGCTECHNSSSAGSAGGTGPEGPHGSVFEPILVRNYVTMDNTPESASAYALCYSCHSRDSILSDESFAEHDMHVRGEDTPCNACHTPHGISATQGNDSNNSHLINFDTSIVFPNSSGQLLFVDQGDRAGTCSLLCHGEEHDNLGY